MPFAPPWVHLLSLWQGQALAAWVQARSLHAAFKGQLMNEWCKEVPSQHTAHSHQASNQDSSSREKKKPGLGISSFVPHPLEEAAAASWVLSRASSPPQAEVLLLCQRLQAALSLWRATRPLCYT